MLIPLYALALAAVAAVIASLFAYGLGRAKGNRAGQERSAAVEATAERCLEAMSRERAELESRHRQQLTAVRGDLAAAEARLADAEARCQRQRLHQRRADVLAAQERRREDAALQARDRELLAGLVERQRLEEALAQVVAARMAEEQRSALLLAAGRRVRAAADPGAVRSETVGLAARQLGVTLWGMFELDRTGQVLRLLAGEGWKGERLERASLAARGGGLGAFVLGAAAPVVVDELPEDTRFLAPPLLAEHGVVSALVVPITGARGPTGVAGFFSAEPRRFSSGDASFAAGVAAVLDQVGARSRASDAVRDERARAAALRDASLDAVLILDDFGRVDSANDAAGAMFGCRAERLRTRNVGDLLWVGGEGELNVARAVQQALRDHGGVRGCTTGQRADGSEFRAQVVITGAAALQGPRMVVVVRDLGAITRSAWAPPSSRPSRLTLMRSGAPLAVKSAAIAAPRRSGLALAGPSGAGLAAP